MSDKPILFSAPMVRALLAGTKTQTRRLFKPQPELLPNGLYHVHNRGGGFFGVAEENVGSHAVDYLRIKAGDRLWVRERIERANGESVGYPADGAWLPNTPWEWKRDSLPSIHMPRWASRITLTVTDVRVERLQEISEADAIAEGIERVGGGILRWENWATGIEGVHGFSPRAAYALLWNSINGPGSWDANPWVGAYSFTVEHCNIDQARDAA